MKNILRSGGFDLFRQSGHRIFIFIQCSHIPDYMQKEFRADNVTLVPIFARDPELSRAHRLLLKLFSYFFWNDTTKRYFRYGKNFREKPRHITWIHICILRIISAIAKFPFFRKCARFISMHFFPEKSDIISSYFDMHEPDLVFSTSITSKIDSMFIKEARRRGITTVSMPKTWDTVTRTYYSCAPDYFLAQNEILHEYLITTQDIPENTIFVTGFPEFDWCAKKSVIRTREEHCKRIGLDPKLPILFFGSQGRWYPDDHTIAEAIYNMIRNNELAAECQLLVRPYFLYLGHEDKFLKYKNLPRAAYDDTHHKSPAFGEGWDPTQDVVIDFINTIYHSDIIIVVLSTLALDAACFEKPIINTLFGSLFFKGKDISHHMAKTTHYRWIFDTGGTSVVYSPEELKNEINTYLKNPEYKMKERKLLQRRLCHLLDGRSSERMVMAIEHIASLS